MRENRRDAALQLFQVVLKKNGTVLCRAVERAYARGFARAWNRLIDPEEPGAYIQALRLVLRNQQE